MDVSKLDKVLDFFYERKDYRLSPFNERANFNLPEAELYRIIRNLKDDNYLDMTSTGNLSKRIEDNEFRISTFGERFKESGGFAAQQEKLSAESAKAEIKEDLQMQELKTNVQLLTNQLLDYDRVKSNAKWAIIIAVVAVLGTLAQVILSLWLPQTP